MGVAAASVGPVRGRISLVYEFFDARVLGRLWFIALTDGAVVQLLPPTFRSEQAARIFERCLLEYPVGTMISLDGQLELARRIEDYLATAPPGAEPPCEPLVAGLPLESVLHGLGASPLTATPPPP